MNANGPHLAVWSVLIVAMLAVILLVGILALLSFKATRPVGVGLLVFFFGGAFLLFTGVFFMRASAVPQQASIRTYPQPPYQVETREMEAVPSQGQHFQIRVPEQAPAIPAIPPVQPNLQPSQSTGPNQAEAVPSPTTVDQVPQGSSVTVEGATENPPVTAGEAPASPATEAPALPPDAATPPPAESPAVPAAVPAEVTNGHPAEIPASESPATPVPAVTPASGAPETIVAEKPEPVPAPRPTWVDAPPHREQQLYQAAVKSGLFVTVGECERALDKAMQRTVDAYIDEYIEDGASQLVAIDLPFIQKRIRRGAYTESVTASVGPMQQVFALLVIDDSVRGEFQQRWRQALVNRRLWQVGAGSAVVLGLVGSLCGFLSWGQRPARERPAAGAAAKTSTRTLATYDHFWLHCALIVAILIGILAYFM